MCLSHRAGALRGHINVGIDNMMLASGKRSAETEVRKRKYKMKVQRREEKLPIGI